MFFLMQSISCAPLSCPKRSFFFDVFFGAVGQSIHTPSPPSSCPASAGFIGVIDNRYEDQSHPQHVVAYTVFEVNRTTRVFLMQRQSILKTCRNVLMQHQKIRKRFQDRLALHQKIPKKTVENCKKKAKSGNPKNLFRDLLVQHQCVRNHIPARLMLCLCS